VDFGNVPVLTLFGVAVCRMRSRVEPHYPMRYQYIVDLVEELTLCK
jgi:hypothetical protein